MIPLSRLLLGVCLLCLTVSKTVVAQSVSSTDEWVPLDPEYTLYLDVPMGRIIIALSKDFAPNHVAQTKLLVRERYYDGMPFFRVIEGFLAQAGEPSDDPAEQRSMGSAPRRLKAEFERPWSDEIAFVPFRATDEYGEQAGFVNGFPAMRSLEEGRVWLTGCTAAVGMGRYEGPDTGGEGFWIALQSMRYNDRQHTLIGRVVWGMEYASRMARTGTDWEKHPERWTYIDSMRVAADVPPSERTLLEIRDTSAPAFQDHVEALRNPASPWFVRLPLRREVCDPRLPDVRVAEPR